MQAAFTEEQRALRGAVRQGVADHAGSNRARELKGHVHDAALWKLLVDVGETDLPSVQEKQSSPRNWAAAWPWCHLWSIRRLSQPYRRLALPCKRVLPRAESQLRCLPLKAYWCHLPAWLVSC